MIVMKNRIINWIEIVGGSECGIVKLYRVGKVYDGLLVDEIFYNKVNPYQDIS